MKKHLITIFLILFIITSMNSFAQVDSSKIANTQRQIDKDQRKADKLDHKAKKQEIKQKRHEQKMERKEKKRERKLKSIEKGERKLENLKKDSTKMAAIRYLSSVKPNTKLELRYFLLPSTPRAIAMEKFRHNAITILLDPYVFKKLKSDAG